MYETCPSGNYYEYYAHSIGARSQSARTYLEDRLPQFKNSTLEELILHSLAALKKSASNSDELKEKIEACFDAAVLEDIYLPYKPKRKTKASVAKEKGLEPLATIIFKK